MLAPIVRQRRLAIAGQLAQQSIQPGALVVGRHSRYVRASTCGGSPGSLTSSPP